MKKLLFWIPALMLLAFAQPRYYPPQQPAEVPKEQVNTCQNTGKSGSAKDPGDCKCWMPCEEDRNSLAAQHDQKCKTYCRKDDCKCKPPCV